jgi:hypothetical protein
MDLNSLNMVCVLHFTIANFERNLALFSVLDVSSLAKAGSIRGFEEPTLIKSLNSKFDFGTTYFPSNKLGLSHRQMGHGAGRAVGQNFRSREWPAPHASKPFT